MVERIIITAKQRINPSKSDNMEEIDFSKRPSRSAPKISPTIWLRFITRIMVRTSMTIGKKVQTATITPKEPVACLTSPRHPCTELNTSLKALPKTGIKLPIKNLVVFVATVSADPETSD